MSRHLTRHLLLAAVLAFLSAAQSPAATLFYDDFSDGNASDGAPVRWSISSGDDFIRIEGESLVVGDNDVNGTGNFAGADASVLSPVDVSFRVQVRLRAGESVALGTRYGALLDQDGLLVVGDGVTEQIFDSVVTDLRVEQEDVVIQVDMIGDQISAWAWKQNDPMPGPPLVTTAAIRETSAVLGLSVGSGAVPTERLEAIFRFAHAATAHIMDGDFDFDGDADGSDLLAWQRGESFNPFGESDLAGWEISFGAAPASYGASGAAVPEPAALGLAILVAASFGMASINLQRF